MERCPNCRARYQEGERCRRCGMDLTPLLAVEAAADRLIQSALLHHLARAEVGASLTALKAARGLRQDPFIELLLGFVAEQQHPAPRQDIQQAAIEVQRH